MGQVAPKVGAGVDEVLAMLKDIPTLLCAESLHKRVEDSHLGAAYPDVVCLGTMLAHLFHGLKMLCIQGKLLAALYRPVALQIVGPRRQTH